MPFFGHILEIYIFQFYSIQCNPQMYIEASLMTEEQLNLVQQRKSSESSHESTYSDDNSDVSDDTLMDKPLLKMVECTTDDLIWDVDTGEPIRTEYDLVEQMNG